MIEIRSTSIHSNDAQALLKELNATLAIITGDDGTAHFQQEDVEQARSAFLIAFVDGVPMGCGALRERSQCEGEIKRVYARRNTCGVGQSLLRALERSAIEFGYQRLCLETRVQNKHAIRFYEANGYTHCESYGVYRDNPNSYCFVKELPQSQSGSVPPVADAQR